MGLSSRAENLFTAIVERFHLSAVKKVYDGGDICFFVAKQEGLQEEVWMCFDNIDEISYGVGSFFGGSAFPCPEAFDDFENNLAGIISGQYRIRYSCWWSVLEAPNKKDWQVKARYSGPMWNGFRSQTFVNSPK